jgi:hypothetical protein
LFRHDGHVAGPPAEQALVIPAAVPWVRRPAAETRSIVDALIRSGYPFEIAGLVYFGFYLVMTRRGNDRFSQRSKAFTLIASIVLVASVPLHYGAQPLGIVLMLAVVALAMWSTYTDRRTPPAS